MSRRYHKSRREPGLIEIAATSNWKVAAGMSLVCVVGALFVIPALFGSSRVLGALVPMLSAFAWLIACVFGAISLLRFMKEQSSAPVPAANMAARRTVPPRVEPAIRQKPESNNALNSNEWGQSAAASATEAKPTKWSREVVDRIEWKRFEDLCCEFYKVLGIRAETTALGADGGVDVRLFQDDTDPQRCTAVVQCKTWNQLVGVKEIRELRGVMAHEKLDKAFFMAPNGFTDDARAFAAANGITLLDSRLFLAMVERLPEASAQHLLTFATAGEWAIPTCPSCGDKMVARDGKRGRFWGCVRYPKCRATMPMRASAF